MQHKFLYCLFTITASFAVICQVPLMQAEGSTAGTTAVSTQGPATGEGKVATVNGTLITREQFDNALAYQQQIAAMQGVTIADEQMPELKYEVLENLIGTELLYQESQKTGVKVEEKEIDESYEAQKQKAQFTNDAEFEAALKETNKTVASYRYEIRQGLAVDHFVKVKFTDTTIVSDSEAKKYYDDNTGYFQEPPQVRVSHIMISVASNADQSKKDEAMNKIEEVLKRLKNGDNFENLANESSEDLNTKDKGGDLGYISKGQVIQSFEDAAFALKEGEISDIVKTNSGYHIIKLTGKKDARTISYEEAKDSIVNGLKTNKVNSAVSQYITVLKNRSTIETFPIGN